MYTPITENAVTGYHVIYQDASGKTYMKLVGPRKSTAHLENLKKFSPYTITVSAVTNGGFSKESKPVIFTTLEDRKFNCFYFDLFLSSFFSFFDGLFEYNGVCSNGDNSFRK